MPGGGFTPTNFAPGGGLPGGRFTPSSFAPGGGFPGGAFAPLGGFFPPEGGVVGGTRAFLLVLPAPDGGPESGFAVFGLAAASGGGTFGGTGVFLPVRLAKPGGGTRGGTGVSFFCPAAVASFTFSDMFSVRGSSLTPLLAIDCRYTSSSVPISIWWSIGSPSFLTNAMNSSTSIDPESSLSIFWYSPMGWSNHDCPRVWPCFFPPYFLNSFPASFKWRENSSGEIVPPPSWSARAKNVRHACSSIFSYSGSPFCTRVDECADGTGFFERPSRCISEIFFFSGVFVATADGGGAGGGAVARGEDDSPRACGGGGRGDPLPAKPAPCEASCSSLACILAPVLPGCSINIRWSICIPDIGDEGGSGIGCIKPLGD